MIPFSLAVQFWPSGLFVRYWANLSQFSPSGVQCLMIFEFLSLCFMTPTCELEARWGTEMAEWRTRNDQLSLWPPPWGVHSCHRRSYYILHTVGIYWRIGLYTERSFWMFLILSNCHAFWDVKMLRLQKFTKPALQRRMLFPRCQAEWFDIFRCISYHFSIFFFLFCHCSCTVCLETLVLGRFCRQVANHCASVTATRFQGHE